MSRDGKRKLGDWTVAAVVALIAIVVTWGAAEVRRQGDQLDRQSETVEVLAQALSDEQSAAEARGEEPVAPDAEELIEDPEYAEADPLEPMGPTDAQVYEAVQDYFDTHPVQDGENASPAQIAAAVINYLTENPPAPGEPGPPPSDEQISNAVAVYLAANPPPAGPPGEDGSDGEDAEPLTSEQIQAELDAYLEAHPLPRCDPGETAEPHTIPVIDGPPVEAVLCVIDN
jgi:hypothetical protein